MDLFELRKNTRHQMHTRAREKAQDGKSGELQVGSSYLYSVGRTNQLFGQTRDEVIGGGIQTEEGEPKIFPIFT